MATLAQVIGQTKDLSRFTDGERRYGHLLFEICQEGRVRPSEKTLKPGLKVRLKNKGSQTHKRGPKRPKY